MPRRRALCAVVLSMLALVGCSSRTNRSSSLRLIGDGDSGGYGISKEHVPVGSPYLFAVAQVCVKGAAATVTGVQVAKPRGAIRIVDWGTRGRTPTDNYYDADDPTAGPGLVSALRGFGHKPVTTTCAAADNLYVTQLNVSVASGTAGLAISHGFTVNYTSAGKAGTLFLPFQVALCTAACPPGTAQDVESPAPSN